MESHLVLINREYTAHLTRIITPYIFESIEKIYNTAVRIHANLPDNVKTINPNKPNKDQGNLDNSTNNVEKKKSHLMIFQNLLRAVLLWNNELITRETERIRRESGTSKHFDKLVRGTIRSYILLLSGTNYTVSGRLRPIGNLSNFYKTVKIDMFIHNCYIEAAKMVYNNPRIFMSTGISNISIIENRYRVYKDIGLAIEEAVRKTVPMNDVIDQYMLEDRDDIADPVPGAVPPVMTQYPQQQQLPNQLDPQPQVQQQYQIQPVQQYQEHKQEYPQQHSYSNNTPLQIQLGQNGQGGGQAVTVVTDANGGGVTIQTGDVGQQQQHNEPRNAPEKHREGAPKPVHNTLSFLLSHGKPADDAQKLLDPDQSQDRHEVGELMSMVSAAERPAMAIADSISFNVQEGNSRKMAGGSRASHRSSKK
jgi:hypothetical protein